MVCSCTTKREKDDPDDYDEIEDDDDDDDGWYTTHANQFDHDKTKPQIVPYISCNSPTNTKAWQEDPTSAGLHNIMRSQYKALNCLDESYAYSRHEMFIDGDTVKIRDFNLLKCNYHIFMQH